MTTNIKYVKQYKEDIWGYYTLRKKRDKLTTLLDLLKVFRMASAKHHYYKLKFHKKRDRIRRQYKRRHVPFRPRSLRSWSIRLTGIIPRLSFIDSYIDALKDTNRYESLLLFLSLDTREHHSVKRANNHFYLRLQNLYTMIFLLTQNIEQQKRAFYLKYILNIRLFYPNFREFLNKNKLTLKHIRKCLVKQNYFYKRIEILSFKSIKIRNKSINGNRLFTKNLDNVLFCKYNRYRQKKFNKTDFLVPSHKFFKNIENQALYSLKKLYRNIKQALHKYPFLNFFRTLDYQVMYGKLIKKVNHELNIFIKKSKIYFNTNVKSNILFFLNPKIKVIKTDLQIINKLLRNVNYLSINRPLLKLKFHLITEKTFHINNPFIRNMRRHQKFVLFQLIYRKIPFNIDMQSRKPKYRFPKYMHRKLNIDKNILRFFLNSTRNKKSYNKKKVDLELKAKKRLIKKWKFSNYFLHKHK